MELRHLRYFVAVAEELHFRRAAERLYVAQPAVSEQIRKLEAELGVRLFDRTQRSVALTDPGRALLVEARRVLQQADVARLAARNARDAAAARLRIGYVPEALPGEVPRALQHLSAAAPAVEVALETGSTLELLQAVRDRRLDAAVANLPAPTRGLRLTGLGSERLVAAVSSAYAAPAVTLAELAAQRLVVLPRESDPALHDTVVALFREAGLAPELAVAAEPRIEAVLLSVAAGGGAALLPAAIAERHALPGVRMVPIADAEADVEAAVITHPESEHLAVHAFLHAVTGVVKRARRGAPAPLHAAA